MGIELCHCIVEATYWNKGLRFPVVETETPFWTEDSPHEFEMLVTLLDEEPDNMLTFDPYHDAGKEARILQLAGIMKTQPKGKNKFAMRNAVYPLEHLRQEEKSQYWYMRQDVITMSFDLINLGDQHVGNMLSHEIEAADWEFVFDYNVNLLAADLYSFFKWKLSKQRQARNNAVKSIARKRWLYKNKGDNAVPPSQLRRSLHSIGWEHRDGAYPISYRFLIEFACSWWQDYHSGEYDSEVVYQKIVDITGHLTEMEEDNE